MRRMGRLMIGLMGTLFLSCLFVVGQVTPCQAQTKLVGTGATSGDLLGFSVSASGNRVVVGAPGDQTNTGAAYVFRYDGSSWVEEAKLVADDGAPYDYFGWSVSISGDTIVVGAFGDESSQGSAYVFRNTGLAWVQETKLVASDGSSPDYFGYAVSVSENTVVVGAFGKNEFTGVAYVFRHDGTGWAEEAKLIPSDGLPYDLFGMSVSMNGTRIVVGSPSGDASDSTPDSGAAYVFRREGSAWIQEGKLVASDGSPMDTFGAAVSISGLRVVVGAPWDDSLLGSVYIFKYEGSTWVEEVKLIGDDPSAFDRFGASVSIGSDRVVVGAPDDDDLGQNSGSVYVFKNEGSGWIREKKLTASDGTEYDYFGPSVSISGNMVVVGATGNENDRGAAYVFVLEEEPPVELYVDIKPGSCVNPINPKSKGVLPVAILGTEDFDVTVIDPRSIRLSREGVNSEVAPVRSHYGDVGTPGQCEPVAYYECLRDGYKDLIVMFKTQQLVEALNLWEIAGERVILTLTANLKEEFGGTALSGQDEVKVLGKKPKPPKKPKK